MVTFVMSPDDRRDEVVQVARDFRAIRDITVALHV
jgi:hypothetical protein